MSAATAEVVVAEVVTSDALAPAFAGLEPSSARQLREAFVPALIQIEEWERQAADLTVTDESQTAKMQMAGVMRKALKKVRVGVEKKRKELGADALARTKAINCAAGIVEGLIVPLEKRLLEQETFGERAEAARRNALGEARRDALRAYAAEPSLYASLGDMGEDAWAALVDSVRLAHEARIEAAKQEAAIRVEAERLATEKRETERQERVKAEAERVERERLAAEENARLRAEAAEREAAAARELAAVKAEADAEAARVRAVHEAERAAAEREARRKHDEDAAARRVAQEAETVRQAERDAELRKAQEETDRAARELAKVQAEAAWARAEAEQATREREAADAAREALEADAKRPTKLKYSLLARTLESIAQWGEPIETCDEPHAAAKARHVLESVGLAPKGTAS
jgi:hypothetical protein